jgi:hypothetical protein
MNKKVKLIPLIPWWLLGKIFRIGKSDRDYDWSLKGWTRMPLRRSTIPLGWAFWVIVILGVLMLAVKLSKAGSNGSDKAGAIQSPGF